MSPFNTKCLWKAKAEPKVTISMDSNARKAPTADNLDAKGWDNNVVCPLCLTEAETNLHLLVNCTYAQEVLQMINVRMAGRTTILEVPPAANASRTMVPKHHRSNGKGKQRDQTGRILNAWWNICKEQNRQIF